MGFLRNILHATALLFTFMMPLASGPTYTDGWNLFFSGILPATAPLIVVVIGLDIMMSSIWKSEASEEIVQHYQMIIRAHLIFGGALLAAWLMVFLPKMV